MSNKKADVVLFEADRDVYGSSATIRQCLSFPVSLLSLREYLRNSNFSVEVLTQGTLSEKGLAEKILQYNPRLVGATASCCEYPATTRIINEIKRKNHFITTVVGGY
ncbi:MAG: hypothetical protein Q8N88_06695, partial [Nanoarchaeota archaeon]|nr:hypothetical protein [Nanoarchaeota archaeon]